MALQARKVSGAFEKQAPGSLEGWSTHWTTHKELLKFPFGN